MRGVKQPQEGGRANPRARHKGLQYTGIVTQDPCADETAVQDALRRQIEDPEDHDVSLIEECLSLTPDERLSSSPALSAGSASSRVWL